MHRRTLTAALLGAALTGASAATVAAQVNDPSFRVVNRTSSVVQEVYASPSTQQNWGRDRLGNDVIQPGASYIVRLPADGNCVYDLRFVYQGDRSEEKRNLNTCNLTDVVLDGPGQAAAPSGPQNNPSFNLVNQSGRVIEQFYASPSSQQGWGADRLGNDVVQPGGRFAVSLPVGECQYDLRVVWRGGDAQERRNLNTCEMNDYVVR
ncbi:MAG: hypothetical protein AVDCRST_MAG08-3197 [uncultured Acetobacteraceae bacterium]|jgi:hypothetical protein|uniref:Uncharacterized protein n=1 Tax=uncultured Acetobacteraceae bacterium TaxID=169975 RepID=A0A6J4JA68_9PROT|nr:MAG: hypothetical protein AVDCRST_MAG08-3197 [uncultured Acetobacteraceae bacterium]